MRMNHARKLMCCGGLLVGLLAASGCDLHNGLGVDRIGSVLFHGTNVQFEVRLKASHHNWGLSFPEPLAVLEAPADRNSLRVSSLGRIWTEGYVVNLDATPTWVCTRAHETANPYACLTNRTVELNSGERIKFFSGPLFLVGMGLRASEKRLRHLRIELIMTPGIETPTKVVINAPWALP